MKVLNGKKFKNLFKNNKIDFRLIQQGDNLVSILNTGSGFDKNKARIAASLCIENIKKLNIEKSNEICFEDEFEHLKQMAEGAVLFCAVNHLDFEKL